MSAVSTLVASVAIAAGAVASLRYLEKRARRFKKSLEDVAEGDAGQSAIMPVLDYERDPTSGVYRRKP